MFLFYKRKVLNLTLLLGVLFFISLNYKKSNDNPIERSFPQERINQRYLDHYCEKNRQFIEVIENVYIRESSAKYLYDRGYIIVYFLSKKGSFETENNMIHLDVEYETDKALISIQDYSYYLIHSHNKYQQWELKCNVSVDTIKNGLNKSYVDIKRLKIYLKFTSPDLLESSQKYRIRIKKLRGDTQRNNTVLCLKPIYLKESDYYSFNWWVEMLKYTGYHKLVVYNNSIPNNPQFNSLFRENEEYIDVYQMNCLPNFIDESNSSDRRKYFDSITDLIRQTDHRLSMEHIYFLAFDMISFGECYYSYSHEYKYVFVHDQDEILLPKLFKNFETPMDSIFYLSNQSLALFPEYPQSILKSDYCKNKKDNHPNLFEEYTEHLIEKYEIPSDHSIFYPQYLYARSDHLEYVFEIFDRELKNISIHDYKDEEIIVYVDDNKFEKNDYYAFVVSFSIKSKKELIYAKNLVYVFNDIIKPFLRKNKQAIEKISNTFTSFIYFNGDLWQGDNHVGKSMHNPDSTTRIHTHWSLDGNVFYMDDEFISHFKTRPDFNRLTVSVYNLNLDLNYFSCYFLPLFEKISKKSL